MLLSLKIGRYLYLRQLWYISYIREWIRLLFQCMSQIISSRDENFSGVSDMKYFLFNHVGSFNHGCEAIVRGTVNIISNADPKAEFVLSSFNPETDNVIKTVEKRTFATRQLTFCEKIISAFHIKVHHSEEYALKKMYSDIVAQARDCDICLSVGGDTYCYGDNRGIQVLTRELKKSGKKVVLWGASIGEEDLSEDKLKSLEDFDAIFTRESLTCDLLKNKSAAALTPLYVMLNMKFFLSALILLYFALISKSNILLPAIWTTL